MIAVPIRRPIGAARDRKDVDGALFGWPSPARATPAAPATPAAMRTPAAASAPIPRGRSPASGFQIRIVPPLCAVLAGSAGAAAAARRWLSERHHLDS